jgi:hypothetical protein
MKNILKLLVIIALAAVIGFSMAACKNGGELALEVKIQKASGTGSDAIFDVSKQVRVGDRLEARTLFTGADGETPQLKDAAYIWYRDGTAISGATGSYYTVVADDVGHKLKVQASGKAGATSSSNSNGETYTATSAETIAVTAN